MLQTIREHTQGWIAGTIISIIILSFALWGIHSYFIGGASNDIVAEVNGVDISKEQLSIAYERLRRQAQSQASPDHSFLKDEVALKTRALQSLVSIEALKQAAYSEGFRVFDNQVDNYLQTVPEFQVNGQFSVERFQEVLSSSLLSTSEFLELVRSSLLINQPKLGVLFTSFALPNETNDTIALVNQERDIDYINIPLRYFLSPPIIISPEKITAYFKAHQSEFMTPEEVSLDYISLSIKDLADKITPTDTMLKKFYTENINSYTQPIQWKIIDLQIPIGANNSQQEILTAKGNADKILESLKKGEDFNKVYRSYPGELKGQTWLSLNQFPPELQPVVAELKKPGAVSEVIKTPQHFIILKVIDFKESSILSFEQSKDKVKETYARQHAEEKFAELRDQLADLTYEHPDSLETAAKTLNLPIKTTQLFTQEKGGSDISQYKKVRSIAFSNDVLNLHNNSDVIQVDSNTAVVIRVNLHHAAKTLPIDVVSRQIENKLRIEEAEVRGEKFTNEVISKLQSGENPQQIAKLYNLEWSKAGFIGRYSNEVDSAILDTAFRLPNPENNQNHAIFGKVKLPDSFALIALKAIKDGVVRESKEYMVFAEQIQNSDGLLEYELYKQSQISKAKIKISQ